MSNKGKDREFLKKSVEDKKSRQFISDDLIRYIEDQFQGEFYEIMKQGYLDMGHINLELSEEQFPEKSLQYKFDDINEYEKWLCGV